MKCKKCGHRAVKSGFQKTGVQRYKCKICNKQFQESYVYKAWKPKINREIKSLVKEGMGIYNIARHLHISATTTIRRIKWIADRLRKPIFHFTGGTYEVDELQTCIGHKKKKRFLIFVMSTMMMALYQLRST